MPGYPLILFFFFFNLWISFSFRVCKKERELETGQRIYWRSWGCCFWSCINIIHTFPCNKTTNTNAQSLRDKEREKIIIKKERKKERRLINSHDLSLFNDPFKTKVTIICFFCFFLKERRVILLQMAWCLLLILFTCMHYSCGCVWMETSNEFHDCKEWCIECDC